MLEKARIAAISGLLGALIAGVAVYVWTLPGRPPDARKTVNIRQISGEPITHSDLRIGRDTVTFTSTADGPGVIETAVPKDIIPEARYWMQRTSGISAVAGYDLARQSHFSLMYWRRWGSMAIGAGAMASVGERIEPGVQIGAMIWF